MSTIDELDQRILDVLLTDSRISLKQLAEQVGLSSPSVSERLRRLEERGVIRHYTVDIDPKALGCRPSCGCGPCRASCISCRS